MSGAGDVVSDTCACGAEVVTRPRRDECPANADGFHRFEATR